MDTRGEEETNQPWAPLVEAVDRREVNGVIGAMLSLKEVSWLQKLPLPLSLMSALTNDPRATSLDHDYFFQSSWQRFKELKCHGIALIGPQPQMHSHEPISSEYIQNLSRKMGMVSQDPWVRIAPLEISPLTHERFGYEQFKEIWSHQDRPDGLIAFPDLVARGVLMGILEKGVHVPDNLKLIFQANRELPMHCPVPVDWQQVSVEAFAKQLIAQVKNLAAGHAPKRELVRTILKPWNAV